MRCGGISGLASFSATSILRSGFGRVIQPRPAARRRILPQRFLAAVLDQPRVKKLAIHRPLHGRRDADRSVGFVEEL